MLFHLFTSFIDQYSFLNVFKYLTFRTGLSVMTSLGYCFYNWRTTDKNIFRKNDHRTDKTRWTNRSYCKEVWNPYYGRGYYYHRYIIKHIIWSDLSNIYVWTLIFVSLSLGGLGLLDDTLKK